MPTALKGTWSRQRSAIFIAAPGIRLRNDAARRCSLYSLSRQPALGTDGCLATLAGRGDNLPEYRVQRGDTLSEIAQRFKTNVRELMALNNLQSKNHIRSGQSLRLLNESAAKAVEFASVRLVAIED